MSFPHWMHDLGFLWDWVDRRQIVRRVMVLGTFVVNAHFVLWAMQFAETTDRSGADIAAIVAAIGVPVAALAGVMFRQYDGQRTKEGA